MLARARFAYDWTHAPGTTPPGTIVAPDPAARGRMLYPVQVAGALLSVGDPHVSQGDGLSRDDAYSFMSVAVDFTVTQVVDGRQGVHGRIDKRCFPRFAGMT